MTVDYLREKGIKAGCVTVYCFRPFPMHQIVETLKKAKAITVFERMDDPLSTTGNHLTREVKAAFCDAVAGQMGHEPLDRAPRIYHGAAGLGSRDVRPADIIAAFDNIPVLSWFLLGGKCRSCRAPISLRYPMVEAMTAMLFVVVVHGHVVPRGREISRHRAAHVADADESDSHVPVLPRSNGSPSGTRG